MSIKDSIDLAIESVIDNTAFIGGKYVNEFEAEFAKMYGVKHCISCANGTDSLYIIMKMLGIGTGDEVITAANSWISSSETISQTGANPVFADVDYNFLTINIQDLEAKITNRTKAIIPVHLTGQVCDMDKILELGKKYSIHVIEDCAQSHFSEFKGHKAGTMGIAGSFSFYPGKNLGAYGDAGCIITNDNQLAEKCRMYARHGALIKHQHKMEGINSRLDGLQAAILLAKLPHILKWTDDRIRVAALYERYLQEIKQIKTPVVRADSKHTFHLYVIVTEDRNNLMQYLKQKNIETAIHYPTALPYMEAYQYLGYNREDFPVASDLESKILSLPIFPEITESEVQYVAQSIAEYFESTTG
nr:DegT/DnrJ/EryC1/StrS family aminotransferase [Flavihumibacter fluminis]